jgi:dTDP-4-amino-4,6-dideoxygalactose transaminase
MRLGAHLSHPMLQRKDVGVEAGDRQLIPFNRPYMTGYELSRIAQAHDRGHLAGDGFFTAQCHRWLEDRIPCQRALLTHSCTAALEMAALLLDLAPGDEVIMPSYTFVSTANAFALHAAVPVFVDVRPDTLNIDERLIEGAITPRTRAICVVHYAGVAAEMEPIMAIARAHGLRVVEDAAQGILSGYRGQPLGSIGDLGTLSFHETKNIMCGEGGALLCQDRAMADRARVLREKGTNRSRFFRGEVDKYTWVDVGSSYQPAELTAAFLLTQMEGADQITARRIAIWERYHEWAEPYERAGLLRRPVVPAHCTHNAHMYYLLLPTLAARSAFIAGLKARGILAVFHYVALHSSPAGARLGRTSSAMEVTDSVSDRLVRMPLWIGLEEHLDYVLEVAGDVLGGL